MSYPQNPAADGDLVVGNLTSRTWNRFAVGADETVLMADSLTGVFDLRWSNELGVKTLRSDFTLTDNVGGTENLVIRVNAAGETSLLSSHASQTFWLGGHSAAGSLQFTQVSGLNTITPATTRGLTFAMDAARELIVKHGAGNSFVFNASYNRSNRQFRQYDTSGASYGTLDADSSGRLYLGGAHAQKQTYIAGVAGSTSDGMLVRDDGDLWLQSTPNNKHMKFNVTTGGVYTWFHNYGQVMALGSTSCSINVPTTLAVVDAVLNNVTYGATFLHATTGGFPVAGFGAGATFLMQDSVLTYRTAAAWEVFWETAVAPVDSAINFRCITAGTYASPNLLYLSGKLQMIGVDTNAPTQKLDVNGGLRVRGLLDHDGTTVGFYGKAPAARPAAYTQTYSAVTRTHGNLTSVTLSDLTGGTATGSLIGVSGTGDDATINDNLMDILTQINALNADLLVAKRVINQVIDDFQLNGLLQ